MQKLVILMLKWHPNIYWKKELKVYIPVYTTAGGTEVV